MSVFGRLGSAMRGMFKPAEDPRQTFASPYVRQRQLLERVHQALLDMQAAKQRLTEQTAEVRRKLPELQAQARRALMADRDEVARLALQRKQIATMELQQLEEHVHAVELEEQRLGLIEQRLSTEIEAFRARQEVIAARYSAAEAQVRINEALGGVSEEIADLTDALAKAEETTERMQARATAIDELVDSGVLETAGTDVVEAHFKAVDVTKAVDAQMAALRSEIEGRRTAST